MERRSEGRNTGVCGVNHIGRSLRGTIDNFKRHSLL